jgi:hypothetical protein
MPGVLAGSKDSQIRSCFRVIVAVRFVGLGPPGV